MRAVLSGANSITGVTTSITPRSKYTAPPVGSCRDDFSRGSKGRSMKAPGCLQYFLGSISTSSNKTLNSDSIPMTGIRSLVRCGIV